MEEGIITKELQAYNTTDAAIAQIRQDYLALTISGIEDKEGYQAIHKARIDVKSRRIAVTKKGKELREDAVRFQKAVIAEEKRIIDLLLPIEDYLNDEEERVDQEKERIRQEVENRAKEKTQARVRALFNLGCRFDGENYIYGNLLASYEQIKTATDEQFEEFCQAIQKRIEEEATIKAEEDRKRKEEEERIARVAQEQEAERQRLAVEARKIQVEKDRLAREQQEREEAAIRLEAARRRAEELEKARAEAAEKARIEEHERIKREAEEKARKEEAARIRAEKREARRPDKEKLQRFIEAGFGNFPALEMKTDEGLIAYNKIYGIMQAAESACREVVEAL